MQIIVNGKLVLIDQECITYDDVRKLAGFSSTQHPSVIFRYPIGAQAPRHAGTLYKDCDPIPVIDRMVINAMMTDNA